MRDMYVAISMFLVTGIKCMVTREVSQVFGVIISVYKVAMPLLQFAHHLRVYLSIFVQKVCSLIDIDCQMQQMLQSLTI